MFCCTIAYVQTLRCSKNLRGFVDYFLFILQAPKLTSSQRQEDLRRMSRALQNLRKYTDILIHGTSRSGYATGGGDVSNLELYWDSWDMTAKIERPPVTRGYHDPKHHRTNHMVSNRACRDESASPKQDTRSDSSDWMPPSTPTTKSIPKVDSAGSRYITLT